METMTSTTSRMESRLGQAGTGLLRLADLGEGGPAAAMMASRMVRRGELRRCGKGLYYRPQQTLLGESRPSPLAVLLAQNPGRVRFRGLYGANLLGLSTQVPARPQIVVYGMGSVPEGIDFVRRPKAQVFDLTTTEGALLELLRDGGAWSEVDPISGVLQLVQQLSTSERWTTFLQVSLSEPPRVRAMLGSLLDTSGHRGADLFVLRESLNPMSRFDFGHFSNLPTAKQWQSK